MKILAYSRVKSLLYCIVCLFVGIGMGGYLFSDTQPRSFLAIHECNKTCLDPNEILGLLGSIGVQKVPGAIPFVEKETEKTIAIESPIKNAPIHYVIIPKRDIKDIADISQEDMGYVIDMYAVIRELVREKNLTRYKVYTNGPGYQHVNYLHFHLLSDDQL